MDDGAVKPGDSGGAHHHGLAFPAGDLELIAATTTRTGLTVKAELDRNPYPTGTKISDAELAAVGVRNHHFHGEWNYDIRPQTRTTLA